MLQHGKSKLEWLLHRHPPEHRHSSTALPCLLEFCYLHQDSIGLHSPILVGEIRADRAGHV